MEQQQTATPAVEALAEAPSATAMDPGAGGGPAPRRDEQGRERPALHPGAIPRITFPLGRKLLLGIGLLLVSIILLLNITTIYILREDKRAYIYQSQSTETVLAGREFYNAARRAVATLRSMLGSFDPLKPESAREAGVALGSLLRNQDAIAHASFHILDPQTGKLAALHSLSSATDLKAAGLGPADLEVGPEWMKAALPDLRRAGVAFLNLSRVGAVPTLAVAVADLKLSHPQGIPVAIGVVPMGEFARQLSGKNLTIATKSGWVLFDSDSTSLYGRKSVSDDPLFQAAAAKGVANGASEYSWGGDRFLGSYAKPGLDLVVLARTQWSRAMKATYALIGKFVFIALMAIGAAAVFAILFSRTVTAPINRLYEATRQVGEGNFDLRLEATGRDEIAALSGSFGVMSRKIADLIRESMEKVQLENELAIASTVQQTLIPPQAFRNEHIYIQSRYQSASQCGGDWWGFFGVEKKLCLMIADATGHGFPSALITAAARSCFSVMHKLAQDDPEFSFSPGAMLSYANRVIFDASLSKIMMTFFIGVIDFETMTITYSSAGHNPPWLFKKEGDKHVLKSLTAVGPRLGETRESPQFEEKQLAIGPEDVLFLYTDGLTEGKNQAGDMYGKKRVRKIIEATVSGGPDRIIDSLMTDFMGYNEGKSLDDDVTIAAALILPPGQAGGEAPAYGQA
jgi:serine phosphatase RsbU (regulator of sigma subunit)